MSEPVSDRQSVLSTLVSFLRWVRNLLSTRTELSLAPSATGSITVTLKLRRDQSFLLLHGETKLLICSEWPPQTLSEL
jgi:hypothetical protein